MNALRGLLNEGTNQDGPSLDRIAKQYKAEAEIFNDGGSRRRHMDYKSRRIV